MVKEESFFFNRNSFLIAVKKEFASSNFLRVLYSTFKTKTNTLLFTIQILIF